MITMTQDTTAVVCRYTAQIEADDNRYLIEVPDTEIEFGTLSAGEAYRITIERISDLQTEDNPRQENGDSRASGVSQAPVDVGEQLDVEIEDIGKQGDGIARVGPGYVLIIPGSDVGDQMTVEVQEVNPNFGFAEIIEYTERAADASEEQSELSTATNQDNSEESSMSDESEPVVPSAGDQSTE